MSAALDVRHRGADIVATIRGDIDSANAGSLLAAIERSITIRTPRAYLDISDVDYLDSAGVHVIFRLARQLAERSGELVVVAPPESIAGAALRHAGATSAFSVCTAVP